MCERHNAKERRRNAAIGPVIHHFLPLQKTSLQLFTPDLSRNFELDDECMLSRFSNVFGGVNHFFSPQDLAGITFHVLCASVRKRVLNFVCRQRVDQVLRVPVHTMTLTRRDPGLEDTNSFILEPDAEFVRINNYCVRCRIICRRCLQTGWAIVNYL